MLDYVNNPDVIMLYFLRDTLAAWGNPHFRTCSNTEDPYQSWGDEGLEDFPLMLEANSNPEIINWFGFDQDGDGVGVSPRHILLDENFYVVKITDDKYEAKDTLDSMLE